ncbi:hypothetical protein HPO96_33900 [Kribbella sandramycini]|uniref:Putative membrane protein n=1 Tax=Kribbella sandramycini TaxID=60450 RepID=A0A7Y4L6G9_9ACTN|nr:hypothetical protein [Kribbella sandramycini]MBB6570392.1 putative membrane protein [Kribbella sandramycini]NOL45254.1 hypothetical protein [Kribbella sandramycini]
MRLGWIKDGALLAPAGVMTMVGARTDTAELRFGRRLWAGFAGLVLGLMAWFFLALMAIAVLRGPFYGLVERGPYGPGTWGGPTMAGAWAVHALVSVPIIVVLAFVLRGITGLYGALLRRLDGTSTAKWVLPATIALCVAVTFVILSWLAQL